MRTQTRTLTASTFSVLVVGSEMTYYNKDRFSVKITTTSGSADYYIITATGNPSISVKLYTLDGIASIDLTDLMRAQPLGSMQLTFTSSNGVSVSASFSINSGRYYPLYNVDGYPTATRPPLRMIEQGNFVAKNVFVMAYPFVPISGVTSLGSNSYTIDSPVVELRNLSTGKSFSIKIEKQVCGKNYIQLRWRTLLTTSGERYKVAVWELTKLTQTSEIQQLANEIGRVPNNIRSVGYNATAVLENLECVDIAYFADIIESDDVRATLYNDDINSDYNKVFVETNSVEILANKISINLLLCENGL